MKLLIVLAVMSLALSGCGDLLGKKVVKKELDPSFAAASCELDMNEFADIMTRPISSQINCLHENLKLFIKIVKSGKEGYLSRIQLERYLAEFRPDVKPEVVKALKSVFEVGHLITGEEQDYISAETIDKVINFALVFNEQAALNFEPIFKSEAQVSYELHKNHRDRVSRANKAIIDALRKIYNRDRNGRIDQISLSELLDSFSNEDTREGIEKVKKLLFGKKVLLGGDEEILTHVELEKLILNFDQFVLIALDAIRYKYIDLEEDSILQLLKGDVNDLYDIINQGDLANRDEEVLFTMDELVNAVKMFVSTEDFDIDKFRNLINEAKKVAMHGNEEVVKALELNNLFNHAKSLLNTGTIFYRIWDKFKVQLMSPQPVTIDFDEYRHTYPQHQNELDQFERIVKNYRFMKGEFFAPYYTRGYKRNAAGVFEIALYEYVLKLFFQVYGSPSSTSPVGGYAMNRVQMQTLLKKFENELVELKLIYPGRALTMADNISLLGTLFQYQSDTNNLLDINETSEFATTVFTAMNVQDDLYSYIKSKGCETDNFDRFEPNCFKENFWPGVCKYYRVNFPLMFESFNTPENCEELVNNEAAMALFEKSAAAGRTCSYYTDGEQEEVPYSKGDVMTLMVVLMHVETTIMRWDTNNNNQLDNDELNKAYTIYGPALDGFLEDKSPIIKKFKKQIYQFLVKYEEVPDEKDFGSIWKFVKFILNFNKNITASRKTMAAILVAIGKENAKTSTEPAFNCNYLRDPDHIPTNPETIVPKVDTRQDFSSVLTPYLHLAQ